MAMARPTVAHHHSTVIDHSESAAICRVTSIFSTRPMDSVYCVELRMAAFLLLYVFSSITQKAILMTFCMMNNIVTSSLFSKPDKDRHIAAIAIKQSTIFSGDSRTFLYRRINSCVLLYGSVTNVVWLYLVIFDFIIIAGYPIRIIVLTNRQDKI